MEINLIYGELKRKFDVPSNVDLNYIKDLCSKIFLLKPNSFELYYNNENLNFLNNNIILQEIVENEDEKILIYVKSISINNKEINKNMILFPNNKNLNSIKLKFDKFNKNYTKLNLSIKEFKTVFQEKLDILKNLINEFENNLLEVDIKIGNFFNIQEYNNIIEIFNKNPEKLNEEEINNLNKQNENLIKNLKIIEARYKYENKIIEYLNDLIKKFQQIKKCNDNIKQLNDFLSLLNQLDLLYSIFFDTILKNFRAISYREKNNMANTKEEFLNELPYIDSNNNINNQNNVLKNNYIQNEKNLFHKYQSNINLFKKRTSNISNLTDKKSEILQLSPNKIKNHNFTNDSYEHDSKSRNKIKRLTTRLKIQLNKNEEENIKQENTLPILKKKKKKEIGKIKEEKKEDNKEKPKKLNLKINLKNNSPINNNNEINENQINEIEENNFHNFLRQKTSFMRLPKNINILEEEKEKFIILDKLKKKTNLKNKRVSISLDKKLTEKSNENSKIENENIHLKNDIESLKNEIEKLKNQNNTLKTEFDNLKNKTEEIQNFEKKLVTNKKTSNLKKGSSSTSLTKKISFNNTETVNEKKGKEEKKNLNDDSKNHSDKKKSKNSIIDLSSKLLEDSFSDFKNTENRKSIKNLSYKEEEKKKFLKRNSVQIDLNQKRFANIDYSLNEKKYENNNSNNTDNNNVYDNLNEYEKDKKKKRRINKYDFII